MLLYYHSDDKVLRVSPYSGGNMWTEVSPGSVSEKKIYGDECLLGDS